mmetsp:Transcript_3790/g.11570  ORF Transcript_3790/g.11570 Transcript_3790/m.11570 type:complete len:238 (+) Transcript_3790:1084-1797(+)
MASVAESLRMAATRSGVASKSSRRSRSTPFSMSLRILLGWPRRTASLRSWALRAFSSSSRRRYLARDSAASIEHSLPSSSSSSGFSGAGRPCAPQATQATVSVSRSGLLASACQTSKGRSNTQPQPCHSWLRFVFSIHFHRMTPSPPNSSIRAAEHRICAASRASASDVRWFTPSPASAAASSPTGASPASSFSPESSAATCRRALSSKSQCFGSGRRFAPARRSMATTWCLPRSAA